MPLRSYSREQDWLLPPSLDELVPKDHPVRFVAAFVDAMDSAAWAELGVEVRGEELGAPAYHPALLLSVWVYGFMAGVRSSRKLERSCRDELPYLWLSGCQHPDHNTLWRFYQANRSGMKRLLKRTVRTAVRMGLVDLAVQAIDGSKLGANAARDRSLSAEGLEKLLERTEKAIGELEAQNKEETEGEVARLPSELKEAHSLRERVRQALAEAQGQEKVLGEKVNLTDRDARMVKGRQGVVVGYNAQVAASPLNEQVALGTGRLITAVEVVSDPDDHAQVESMLKEAEATTGERVGVSLLDAGYHSGSNLEACERAGYEVLMPEAQAKALSNPYHKDHFERDETDDSYVCPQGQRLRFSGIKRRRGRLEARVYRATAGVCASCPVFGLCTKDRHGGRALEIGPHEERLRRHRVLMATPEAKATYRRRLGLVEPIFGILKEVLQARRFLLRGLENVRAEWALLATAFNLKTLFGVWRRQLLAEHLACYSPATS